MLAMLAENLWIEVLDLTFGLRIMLGIRHAFGPFALRFFLVLLNSEFAMSIIQTASRSPPGHGVCARHCAGMHDGGSDMCIIQYTKQYVRNCFFFISRAYDSS